MSMPLKGLAIVFTFWGSILPVYYSFNYFFLLSDAADIDGFDQGIELNPKTKL